MNNIKHIIRNSLLVLLLSSSAILGANAFAQSVGQVDFADLSNYYGEPRVEVNLTSNLMQMMGAFAAQEDPEAAEILANLQSVKVRVYDMNGEVDKAMSTLESVSKELKSDQWQSLVTVNNNEDNQKVRILAKSTNDVIDGVVVMVVSPEKEGGEAVFINIVGEIDPAKIAKVTKTLDIDIQ